MVDGMSADELRQMASETLAETAEVGSIEKHFHRYRCSQRCLWFRSARVLGMLAGGISER